MEEDVVDRLRSLVFSLLCWLLVGAKGLSVDGERWVAAYDDDKSTSFDDGSDDEDARRPPPFCCIANVVGVAMNRAAAKTRVTRGEHCCRCCCIMIFLGEIIKIDCNSLEIKTNVVVGIV